MVERSGVEEGRDNGWDGHIKLDSIHHKLVLTEGFKAVYRLKTQRLIPFSKMTMELTI